MIDNMLRHLARWYTKPEVEEVAINRPGEIWLRRRKPAPGEPIWQPEEDANLTYDYLLKLCCALANVRDIMFNEQKLPLLYTTLPGGHRFTAILGQAALWEREAEDGAALTIRQHRPDVGINFSDYGIQPRTAKVTDHVDGNVGLEEALEIIKNGGSALLVGSTSTGKTTCLNLMLRDVLPIEHRVVALEDTPELIIPQPNRVPIFISRTQTTSQLDYTTVIDLVVRMTPDVVLCGEISTRNAGTVAELMETGHKNFLATIHGESAAGGFRAFYQRLTHTRPNADPQTTYEMLGAGLDLVLHLDRTGGLRHISEIVRGSAVAKSLVRTN